MKQYERKLTQRAILNKALKVANRMEGVWTVQRMNEVRELAKELKQLREKRKR